MGSYCSKDLGYVFTAACTSMDPTVQTLTKGDLGSFMRREESTTDTEIGGVLVYTSTG